MVLIFTHEMHIAIYCAYIKRYVQEIYITYRRSLHLS